MMMPQGLISADPVTFEVVRSNLYAICEEMKSVVMRAAFSPLLSLSADLSCAVLDPSGDVVAQGNDIPVHLGAMPFTAQAILATYPCSAWAPGDAVIHNDPYQGGTHLPDMTVMTGVFDGERVIAFVASRVHWPDVGGPIPGSSSVTDHILKEGIRVPPVRIMRYGVLDRPVVDLLIGNMRMQAERFGDLRAQIAGNERGVIRLGELVGRYGAATVSAVMRDTLAYTQAEIEAGLARFPEGRFAFEESLDGDGFDSNPLRLRATVSRHDSQLHVDFAGTSPCARGPINAPMAVTASAVYYAILAAFGGGAAPNSGAYRPVRIRAEPGCLVNAIPPFPVVAANTETSNRLVDVIFGALAQAGDFAIAGSYGSAAVYTIGGHDPRRDRAFVHYETIGGGLGAGPSGPGCDGIRVHMGNTMNLPVEAMEASMPVRFEAYELVEGSGGMGRHSGGRGVCKRLTALVDGLQFSALLERSIVPAPGLRGGSAGAPAAVRLTRAGAASERLPSKARLMLNAGDTIEIATAGGGAWGAATE